MHNFATKLGTVNESQHEEDQQGSLKKLELLLMTDVSFLYALNVKSLKAWGIVVCFRTHFCSTVLK